MTRLVWLASYPKSGNTWFRMLAANLSTTDEAPLDINDLPAHDGIASNREPFDQLLLIESGVLTAAETDRLRPRLHEAVKRETAEGPAGGGPPVRLVKTHDAYTLNAEGEPLLGGARGADGAIVVVRDPRDVAPSLASHNRTNLDQAIAFMADRGAVLSGRPRSQGDQLRQTLLDWSGHVTSWLDQRDIPVCLVRYEDLQADAAATLARALDFAGAPPSLDEARRAAERSAFAELRRQEEERGFREAPGRAGARFFRRGQAGAWREELSAEQVARIERDHGALMRRLGYALSTG